MVEGHCKDKVSAYTPGLFEDIRCSHPETCKDICARTPARDACNQSRGMSGCQVYPPKQSLGQSPKLSSLDITETMGVYKFL